MVLSTRCKRLINYDLSPIEQNKMANFSPLTPEITWLMFTHLKRSAYANAFEFGPRTLLPGNFQPLNFIPNRTDGAGRTQVGLCPKF